MDMGIWRCVTVVRPRRRDARWMVSAMLGVIVVVATGFQAQAACTDTVMLPADREAVDDAREALVSLRDTGTGLMKASDAGSKGPMIRALSSAFKTAADDLREAKDEAKNRTIVRALKRLSRSFAGIAEMMDAAVVVIDARENNNVELLQNTLQGLIDGDARRLVAPVSSRVELEERFQSIGKLLIARLNQAKVDIHQAGADVKCASGVDLSSILD